MISNRRKIARMRGATMGPTVRFARSRHATDAKAIVSQLLQ